MQVLYQELFGVLSRYRLSPTIDSIYQDMISPRGPLAALLRSRTWKAELFQIAKQFGVMNRQDVRTAIHSDHSTLVRLFSSVLMDQRQVVLSLTGNDAGEFLALAWDIQSLDCVGVDTANTIRRIATKLAVAAFIFPRSQQVTRCARDPMATGGTGLVYEADIGDLKVVLKRIFITPNTLAYQQVIREATTWSWLRHEYILPCLGIDSDTFVQPSIVSPLMPYTLSTFRPSTERRVITQLVDALAYIHSMGIVHGDIKPENVLLDEHGNVRLGDFDISIYADTTTLALSGKGTRARMAPELWRDAADSDIPVRKTFSSDMYSFGLLCYELFAKKLPWKELKAAFCLLENRRLLAHKPSMMPHDIWQFVERCISIYPEERLTSAEVLRRLQQLSI